MQNKTLNSSLTALTFVIIAVGLFMGVAIAMGYESWIGPSIWLVTAVMIASAGLAVLFGLVQLLTNFKRNLSLLVGLLAFVVIGIICWSVATGDLMSYYPDAITESISRLSGAGLYFMYVLILVAVVAAVIGEVVRIFK